MGEFTLCGRKIGQRNDRMQEPPFGPLKLPGLTSMAFFQRMAISVTDCDHHIKKFIPRRPKKSKKDERENLDRLSSRLGAEPQRHVFRSNFREQPGCTLRGVARFDGCRLRRKSEGRCRPKKQNRSNSRCDDSFQVESHFQFSFELFRRANWSWFLKRWPTRTPDRFELRGQNRNQCGAQVSRWAGI